MSFPQHRQMPSQEDEEAKSILVKNASEILASQIDLEIALRKRIAEAANAKIAWAQAMQSAVFKGSQVSAYGAKDHSTAAFQRESLHTLHAISRLAPTLEPKDTPLPEIGLANEEESEAIAIERPADIAPVTPLLPWNQKAHLPSNHEECVERCGRVVTGPEALRIRREGTMATGQTLPGIRKLLELAIRHGGDMGPSFLYQSLGLHADSPALAAYLGKTVQRKQIRVFEPEGDIDVVTVRDEDRINPMVRHWRPPSANHVIDSDDDSAFSLESKKVLLSDLSLLKRDSTLSVAESEVPASRFHIKRRIIITDWSQQIPQRGLISLRSRLIRIMQAGVHLSHKWMVSITSPSYSNHVTTFLSRLSISSGSDPPPPCFISSRVLSTDSPPYSIIGTTNRPFLARIKLEWVGGPTKSLEVEHWVRPRIGEEQILDVELDRGTPFRGEIITPQLSWDIPVQDIPHSLPVVKLEYDPISPLGGPYDVDPTAAIQPFESVLRSLVQGIPFTLEETIGRDTTLTKIDVPKSRDVFLSLVDGRRKAYEFRYARTLHERLQNMALGDPTLLQAPAALRAVTPGLLYRWLCDQDFFPRPEPAPLDATKQFCSFCGLEAMEHPSPLKLEDKDGESIPNVCPEAHTLASFGHMPAVDVHAWLASIMAAPIPLTSRPSSISTHFPLRPSAHDLVQSTDPRLVHFVHDAVLGLRLPFFRSPYTPGTTGHIFPLDQLGQTSDEVENAIAPYSLLSRVVCLVVRDLVQGGISVARATAAHVRSKAYMQRMSSLGYYYSGPPRYHHSPTPPEIMNAEERSLHSAASSQVLTPSHILRGLESGSIHMARLRMAVSRLTVAKTGIALGGVAASVSQNNNHNEARVKEEPDWE
ncbi:hypothetical protein BS47DRAFT_1357998 [Hydnum rufescens UP504]|uniref:YEATS domain-containing protein n=1 Tax=Hydnum rufescens UP504 TaxID=1448309 RepID=A0A9P6B8V6_9AGAM|nr:hypothetical protein BS47DRAFT_1357998 [Hydnum rufescens UP504]